MHAQNSMYIEVDGSWYQMKAKSSAIQPPTFLQQVSTRAPQCTCVYYTTHSLAYTHSLYHALVPCTLIFMHCSPYIPLHSPQY